jgi:dihydrofolate reductase
VHLESVALIVEDVPATSGSPARIVYLTNMSLDGYIEDRDGAFDWAPPDDEVFAATTAVLRSFGTYLYGRRLYETMAVWETDPSLAGQSELTAAFADVWRAAGKVVYSRTLTAVSTAASRLERSFDPAAVRVLKTAATADLTIGGADLAAQAISAGLVDECSLFVWPMLLGGGRRALPEGIHASLELVDERRFANGVVHLRYRIPT